MRPAKGGIGDLIQTAPRVIVSLRENKCHNLPRVAIDSGPVSEELVSGIEIQILARLLWRASSVFFRRVVRCGAGGFWRRFFLRHKPFVYGDAY